MTVFFCRLLPPRPSFLRDITQEEMAVMQRHAAYWQPSVGSGAVIAMGPVDDPKGTFGMSIIEAESRAALDALIRRNPALELAGAAYEISVMPRGVMRSEH